MKLPPTISTVTAVNLKAADSVCRLFLPYDSLLSLYDRPLPAQRSWVMKKAGGQREDSVLSTNQTDALYTEPPESSTDTVSRLSSSVLGSLQSGDVFCSGVVIQGSDRGNNRLNFFIFSKGEKLAPAY